MIISAFEIGLFVLGDASSLGDTERRIRLASGPVLFRVFDSGGTAPEVLVEGNAGSSGGS